MSDVIQIKPCVNVSATLRCIADDIDAGIYEAETCTFIIGTCLFHLGSFTDECAAERALWDMQYGINKLMKSALSIDGELNDL